MTLPITSMDTMDALLVLADGDEALVWEVVHDLRATASGHAPRLEDVVNQLVERMRLRLHDTPKDDGLSLAPNP